MLRVFRKYLGYFYSGECLILMITAALIHDRSSFLIPLVFALVLSLVLLLVLELLATAMHLRLLGILYAWQRPKDFVTAYSVLFNKQKIKKNIRFTIIINLSNGYSTMGDFKKALELLDYVPIIKGKMERNSKAILNCNRCNIFLWNKEIDKAREEYNSLIKIGMKSMKLSEELFRIRLAVAEGTANEEDSTYVRNQLRTKGSALYKTELSYLLGDIYMILGEKELSRSYYDDVAHAGEQLWVSNLAKSKFKLLVGC